MQFFEDCEKISKTSFVHSQSQYYPDIKRGPTDVLHVTAIHYQYDTSSFYTWTACLVVPFPYRLDLRSHPIIGAHSGHGSHTKVWKQNTILSDHLQESNAHFFKYKLCQFSREYCPHHDISFTSHDSYSTCQRSHSWLIIGEKRKAR